MTGLGTTNVSFCTSCGAPLPTDGQFCSSCGAPSAGPIVDTPRPLPSPTVGGGLKSSLGGRFTSTPPMAGAPGPGGPGAAPTMPDVEVTRVATSGFGGGHPGGGERTVAAAPSSPRPSMTTPPGAPHGSGQNGWKIGVGVLGVFLLAGLGWFIVRAVTGGGGGAASPEAAVSQIVDAANNNDVAGVLAGLNPDEVTQLAAALQTVQDTARKTGAAPEDDALAGFAIELDDLELSEDRLSDDVVKVTIDRIDARASFSAEEVADRIKGFAPQSGSATFDEDDLVVRDWDFERDREVEIDPFVVTVKRGGGWYVSPEYTVMQYVVEVADLPEPDFTSELPDDLDGADSATEALEGFADSLDEMDPEEWMRFVPDNERRGLWAYRDAIDELLTEHGAEGAFEFDVDDLEVTEKSLSGGDKALTVTNARGTAQGRSDEEYGYYAEETDWRYDGRCLETESDSDGDVETCADHRGEMIRAAWYPLGSLFTIMGDGGTVVAQKEHGAWVISPLASLTRTLKERYEAASTEELYAWIGVPQFAPATGPLTLGERLDGTFNGGGYAVFDVELAEDTPYFYERNGPVDNDVDCGFGDGECWIHDALFGPDSALLEGESLRGLGGDRDADMSEAFRVEKSGKHRLVIFGKPGADYSILLGEVPNEPMPEGGASGEFTRDRPAITYRFSVDQSGTWVIEDQESGGIGWTNLDLRTEDGEMVDYSGPGYHLVAGTVYEVTISGSPGDRFDLAIDRGGATLDGQSTVTGSVYGDDEASFQLEIHGDETVRLELSYDAFTDTDMDIVVTGGCDWDGGTRALPDSEWVTVTGPCTGGVLVFPYAGRGGSDFTLTVETY